MAVDMRKDSSMCGGGSGAKLQQVLDGVTLLLSCAGRGLEWLRHPGITLTLQAAGLNVHPEDVSEDRLEDIFEGQRSLVYECLQMADSLSIAFSSCGSKFGCASVRLAWPMGYVLFPSTCLE